MKFFVANKEIQSPIVEAICGVVENGQCKLLHSIDDDSTKQFVDLCIKAGIEFHNVSAEGALHLIIY
jgi:hypothetical protein